MRGTIAGRRYAKSLMDLSIEQNVLEAVYADMEHIAATVNACADLEVLLKSPVVKPDKKEEILIQIFGSQVSKLTLLFIKLITSKGRSSILKTIAFAFVDQYKTHKNIVVAEVTSAIKLDDVQKQKIVRLLAKDAANNIEIVEKINPDVIGGFIVRVGDKQIDASIARELADLRMAFSDNPYIAEF